jgi:cytochrome b561
MWQISSTQEAIMQSTTKSGYSVLQISLHWLVALLVLFQLVFGESMTEMVDAAEEGNTLSPFDQFMGNAHYWVGIAILALVCIRLIVRIATGAPAPVPGNRLMVLAGEAAHWLFYVLLFAVPVTGLLAIYVNDEFGEIHELAKPAFILLIVLHAGAALYHHFFLKDSTLRRMLVPVR